MAHEAQPYPAAHQSDEPGDLKDRFRAEIRTQRAARSARRLADAGAGIAHVVRGIPEVAGASTLAAYVSRPGEPPTGPLLAALVAAGTRVLLPVLGQHLTRDWAAYDPTSPLVTRAPGRPPEPEGPTLGPAAIAGAEVLLVPALAVDTTGRRIGQGSGWYDRVLADADPDALVVALVFEPELYDASTRPLPDEPHDRRVAAVATPQRWLRTRR